jgi:hypothetical protein
MSLHWLRTVAVAGLGILASGCYSSNYIPPSRGRVSTIMKDSQLAYVRDGRIYKRGTFGKGLIRAVQGVPAAERAAREFHTRQRNGFMMFFGGLLCSGVALGVGVARVADENGRAEKAPTTELLVAAGCLIFGYAGLFHAASAAPYQYDAINIFNESTAQYLRGPPGYRDPYGRPYGARPACKTEEDRRRHPMRCASAKR